MGVEILVIAIVAGVISLISGATSITNTQGSSGSTTAPGSGDADYVAGVAIGGNRGASSGDSGSYGGNGRVIIQFA